MSSKTRLAFVWLREENKREKNEKENKEKEKSEKQSEFYMLFRMREIVKERGEEK